MFNAPFTRPMRPPFGPALASTAVSSWWLSGGIASANCIAAYAPKGAASLAASYSNLANPGTYDAAPGVAPTWNATNGWIFNGSSQYLTCGITPAAGWSMIVRFSNNTSSAASALAGCRDASANVFNLFPTNSGNHTYGYSGALNVTGVLSSGVMAIASNNCYLDGALEGTTTGSTLPALAIFLGARNLAGSPSNYVKAYIQAFAIYNTTITAPQVAALVTAMNAL